MLKKIFFIGVLTLVSIQSHALSVSLFGVQDNSQINSSNLKIASQSGSGGGLLLNMHLGGLWTFSTGGVSFTRGWLDTTSGTNTLTSQVLMVPAIFAVHLRWLTFGVGGYYSQNQGTLSESGTVNNTNLAYSSYGINNTDYGYLGRIGFHFPIGHAVAFELNAQYISTATNQSVNTANTFQNRDVQYLAGFVFRFGAGGGKGSSTDSKSH